jgi:hypothetical protein
MPGPVDKAYIVILRILMHFNLINIFYLIIIIK